MADSKPPPSASRPTRVAVVGIGADGWEGLAGPGRAAVLGADRVIGGQRHLSLLPDNVRARRVPLPSPLLPALEHVLAEEPDASTVVLASGDPMFHGIGSTLVRLLGAGRVEVLPHPSSVSLAAARLGWPLDDVEVVSAVARPLAAIHPALQPGRRVLVLVAESDAAAKVRELLDTRGFGASRVTVLSDLGGPDEAVRSASNAEHSLLAIVAIECVADPEALLLPRTPGLPDEAFEHDGQITKHEIRALVLAALGPAPGQLLWDVGAGVGSVGVEWMRVHPANRAIAIEPRGDRRELIRRNAVTLGVPSLRVIASAAPEALIELPAPDAVFIGGGATVDGVVQACWDALSAGGRLVANAVTVESEQALVAWHGRLGGTLTRVSVERAAPLGGFTAWRPAFPVVQWAVTKQTASVAAADNGRDHG